MAEEHTGRKSKLRREGEEDKAAASPSTIAPTPQIQPTLATPAISPEVRDELTGLMQDLLLKTHELSFEFSTMECEEIANCPLAKKSKELFRVVKRLNETVRKMASPTQPGYVR
jgi:hypothetical protein